MHYDELLHRFFDDGLEDSLEDSLFGRIAVDADLRRQFVDHLKLHSLIQEDMASITTPAHVKEQLFVQLGLTPPAVVHSELTWTRKASLLLAAAGARVLHYRGYIATALLAAGITAAFFVLQQQAEIPSPGHSVQSTAPDMEGTSVATPIPAPSPVGKHSPHAQSMSDAAFSLKPAATETDDAVSRQGNANRAGASASMPDRQAAVSVAASGSMLNTAAGHDLLSDAVAALSPHDLRIDYENSSIDARLGAAEAQPLDITQTRLVEPWHFYRPSHDASLLSNLVFELRKQFGQSWPEIDLPHSSHQVFENMSLNVVYKVTEHHAFGFEYGREDFGQRYERAIPVRQSGVADPGQMDVGPPRISIEVVEFQQRRMLDVFGAVWKLSLPDHGFFGIVYPYMRTFVGATRQGPLGKVRVGLEMYPSNFSMFSVGIEGGMLRYSAEQSAYYTAKLNYSLGVAVGF
jgi:hypothetical protein